VSARVFVAGATGVLGRRVVRALVRSGYDVTGLTRSPDRAGTLVALGATAVVADAYDREQLTAAVEHARPDVIIHQLTDLSRHDSAANARLRRTGTANLVAAARACSVERVVAQSIAWAYAPTGGPADETVPLDVASAEPRRTTVAAIEFLEAAVRTIPDSVVLRYGMLYGPDTWFTRDGSQAAAARAGRLPADDAVTSFVHVDDAAAAAVQALAWPAMTVNIVDDEPAPASAWVPDFCDFLAAPRPVREPGGAPWASGASNELARRTGWVPTYPSWRGNWGRGS
jgi:nucleoside-diphosphate-sugar epimerase